MGGCRSIGVRAETAGSDGAEELAVKMAQLHLAGVSARIDGIGEGQVYVIERARPRPVPATTVHATHVVLSITYPCEILLLLGEAFVESVGRASLGI